MEERYKICLSGTTDAVEGCEDMSQEEALVWLSQNNEFLAEAQVNEFGDSAKYIMYPLHQVI